MLITPATYDDPSFVIGPVNNNRTAWRPFSLPVVLIIPFATTISTSRGKVSNLKVYIEDVPQVALVAGHDHVGQMFPDRLLYSQSLDALDLVERRINIGPLEIINSEGAVVTQLEAATDYEALASYQFSTFTLTLANGTHFELPYIPDAEYYDLSDVQTETEQLPIGRYNLVYEASYYPRVMSVPDRRELSCLSGSSAQTRKTFQLNHPGEVLAEMVRLSPSAIFSSNTKANDPVIAFYRIFADALNDVYDEFGLLRGINSPSTAPYELLPHLASLLGWNLPYYPASKDKIRRAVIVSIDQLQRLKGSRRAIEEIFKLFGFKILLSPIWWSVDGKRLIRPGERLPEAYADEEIHYQSSVQTETLLHNYSTPGFGGVQAPLLHRPQKPLAPNSVYASEGPITVRTISVVSGSDADEYLQGLGKELSVACDQCVQDFYAQDDLDAVLEMDGFLGFSKLRTDSLGQAILDLDTVDDPAIIDTGLKYDTSRDIVSIFFNGYQDFSDRVVYCYATYLRQEVVVPEILADLQSNRFAIQILQPDGTTIPSDVLDFLIDFVYKVKAFQSLLEVISLNTTITDVYQVTDFCLGGDVQQRSNTDAGRQQVPPAILPAFDTDGDCIDSNAAQLGYKASDIAYRQELLRGLLEEYKAWLTYNERVEDGGNHSVRALIPGNVAAAYNPHGQDRVEGDREEGAEREFTPGPLANSASDGMAVGGDLSPIDTAVNGEFSGIGNSRNDTSGYGPFNVEKTLERVQHVVLNRGDYCYKGRVADELLLKSTQVNSEVFRNKILTIGQGSGVYWTYPQPTKVTQRGIRKVKKKATRTEVTRYSAGASDEGRNATEAPGTVSGLRQQRAVPLAKVNNSWVGKQLRAYGVPVANSLHYTNRPAIADLAQSQHLALQRPHLDVDMPYQHFPGCRFPTQGNLEEDFSHETWKAKPWDEYYSDPCSTRTLNPVMVVRDDGDEELTYDSTPFFAPGNGIVPDISSFGEHLLLGSFAADSVVHSVYTTAREKSCIELEGVTYAESATAEVSSGLFATARTTTGTDGSTIDYLDGYPALTGYYSATPDIYTDILTSEVAESLGIPAVDITGVELLFKNISGILDGLGLRLDGGCLQLDHGYQPALPCILDELYNQDDYLDMSPDQVWVDRAIVPTERLACTYRNDGSLPYNLMLAGEVTQVHTPWRRKLPEPPRDVSMDGDGLISWTASVTRHVRYEIMVSEDGTAWKYIVMSLDAVEYTSDPYPYAKIRARRGVIPSVWVDIESGPSNVLLSNTGDRILLSDGSPILLS